MIFIPFFGLFSPEFLLMVLCIFICTTIKVNFSTAQEELQCYKAAMQEIEDNILRLSSDSLSNCSNPARETQSMILNALNSDIVLNIVQDKSNYQRILRKLSQKEIASSYSASS